MTARSSHEDDACRGTDRRVLTRKGECAGFFVDPKRRDLIAALVTHVEKIPAGIDIELRGIIAQGGSVANMLQVAGIINGKRGDGVVEPIGGIQGAAIGRH